MGAVPTRFGYVLVAFDRVRMKIVAPSLIYCLHQHQPIHLGIRRDGRITPQWQELGFQGHDPATDFRGMGK